LLLETDHTTKSLMDDSTSFIGHSPNRALNTTVEQPPYISAASLIFYLDLQ